MTKREKSINQLADIVEANPGCKFEIDNDAWHIIKELEDEEIETLATSDDYDFETEWYSDSACYGAGLSEVLLELLRRRGLIIEASSV